MKFKRFTQFSFAALILFTHCASAQKKLKEGKLLFDITYPESDLDQQTLAMMPSESTVFFKEDKSRSEMKMPMGTTVSITDGKKGETTMLMELMGNKMAIRVSKDDLEKQQSKLDASEKPQVKLTGETKIIAGFTCHKASVTTKDKDGKEMNFDLWYTKEISAPNSMRSGNYFQGIDGFMMEFQTKLNSLSMKMSCRSAEETTVADSLFTIPPGYKLTTMDELKNSMGGAH